MFNTTPQDVFGGILNPTPDIDSQTDSIPNTAIPIQQEATTGETRKRPLFVERDGVVIDANNPQPLQGAESQPDTQDPRDNTGDGLNGVMSSTELRDIDPNDIIDGSIVSSDSSLTNRDTPEPTDTEENESTSNRNRMSDNGGFNIPQQESTVPGATQEQTDGNFDYNFAEQTQTNVGDWQTGSTEPAGIDPDQTPLTDLNTTPPTPEEPQTPEQQRISQLEEQVRRLELEMNALRSERNVAIADNNELRGLNTPEQQSTQVNKRLAELEAKANDGTITDEERIEYFQVLNTKRQLDSQIQTTTEQEDSKRKRKEKIIKWVAGVAGFGIGVAVPGVSVAAVIAVSLGGNLVGRGLGKLSERMIAKTRGMKAEDRSNMTMEQLTELDKKIKRNEWWAKRFGEIGAALYGGSIGFGLGQAAQNIFNAVRGPQEVGNAGIEQQIKNPAAGGPSNIDSGVIKTPPVGTGVEQSTPLGDWFDTSRFGWNSQEFGWNGSRLATNQSIGGVGGARQGEFISSLFNNGVTEQMLYGQDAGRAFADGMRAIYTGTDPVAAASTTAEAIKALGTAI